MEEGQKPQNCRVLVGSCDGAVRGGVPEEQPAQAGGRSIQQAYGMVS